MIFLSEEEKLYEKDGREIKHFDPDNCDVCFMLMFIFSLSQGCYPQESVKQHLFELKRNHTTQEFKIKLEEIYKCLKEKEH